MSLWLMMLPDEPLELTAFILSCVALIVAIWVNGYLTGRSRRL